MNIATDLRRFMIALSGLVCGMVSAMALFR